MFDLPALDGVQEVVISPDVVDGKARPLYIYSERREDVGSTAYAGRRRGEASAMALGPAP